ncbi:hypothetical protein [Aquimarina agarivorans]|uniref:hypothetical protein n=1 Tax=Aquimarina agarivorans TaxID=980584 RepID=UPI000248E9BA|nr:hypothetical protein [Aquimarina agarivorans]
MKNYIAYISILSLAFVACEPEFDNEVSGTPAQQERGEADFTTYVALGNSLTAGVADQTLYIDGQQVAFPVIIAEQMKAAGGGEFTVPLMADNIGGFPGIPEVDDMGNPIEGTLMFPPKLVFNAATRLPETIEGVSTTLPTTILDGSFNNMGVPGAKSFHLVAENYGNVAGLPTGNANPFFTRFASDSSTTILADALAQQPTFFSLWIGGNDVLSYATSGGTGINQLENTDPSTYSPDDLTNVGVFATVFPNVINALTANGAKGLVMNIPDVKTLPFFTTVPNNALVLNAEQAAGLTGFFRAYVGILTQSAVIEAVTAEITEARTNGVTDPTVLGQIQEQATQMALAQAGPLFNQYAFTFNSGPNRFLIQTAPTLTNPAGLRQMTENELLLLSIDQNALRTQGYGSAAISDEVLAVLRKLQAAPETVTPEEGLLVVNAVNPIEDKDVLDTTEINEIEIATAAFNEIIKTTTEANDLALYDANARLQALSTTGINVNGTIISNTFVSGGFFSLDGVHLSPRGNAVIANEMMETINAKYGSTLQPVESGAFPTVRLK